MSTRDDRAAAQLEADVQAGGVEWDGAWPRGPVFRPVGKGRPSAPKRPPGMGTHAPTGPK